MDMKKHTIKSRLVLLTAVIILIALSCTGFASGFTVTQVLPSGSSITQGDPVFIKISGLSSGNLFNLSISSSDLSNTANGGLNLTNFNMPLGLQTGTANLTATGTNVAQLGLKIQGNSNTIETYTVSGGPTLTITSNKDINKQLYQLIQITGQPSDSAQNVGISLWANGTIATADDPANLNFVFLGTALGHLTISVYSGNTQISSQTLTISAPAAAYVAPAATSTNNTAALTSGTAVTLDFVTQTGSPPAASINVTPSANVASGPVYVDQYTQPPTGSSTPSTSTYKALGKYMTISSPYLEGNVASANITMYYTTTDLTNAGVTDESKLRLYYYNTGSGAGRPLVQAGTIQ